MLGCGHVAGAVTAKASVGTGGSSVLQLQLQLPVPAAALQRLLWLTHVRQLLLVDALS